MCLDKACDEASSVAAPAAMAARASLPPSLLSHALVSHFSLHAHHQCHHDKQATQPPRPRPRPIARRLALGLLQPSFIASSRLPPSTIIIIIPADQHDKGRHPRGPAFHGPHPGRLCPSQQPAVPKARGALAVAGPVPVPAATAPTTIITSGGWGSRASSAATRRHGAGRGHVPFASSCFAAWPQ